MKIVINACHGGFSLSKEAWEMFADCSGFDIWVEQDSYRGLVCWLVPEKDRVPALNGNELQEIFSGRPERDLNEYYNLMDSQQIFEENLDRDDPVLVEVVEALGNKASGSFSRLKVVEIPDDVEWVIKEYDGCEWVAEKHRTWE